jgi:hypothetical protein
MVRAKHGVSRSHGINRVGGAEDFCMRSISIQRPGDLPPEAKAAVEQLLGRTLAADEQISIIASPPEPSVPENREEVARKLAAFLDSRTEEARDVPEEEIDAAIDEACGYVWHHS